MTQRKDQLNVKSLMALLGTADRDSRAVLLRLIERSATEVDAPRPDAGGTAARMLTIRAQYGTHPGTL